MKFELVDFVMVAIAAVMLASYVKLQSTAFLYVFIVLILAEVLVMVWPVIKKEPKEQK